MKKGFTLVELSIVLVIIGLLIGGILVGQSLIESAKLNSFISQMNQYDSAIRVFHNKFKAIPGDSTFGAVSVRGSAIKDSVITDDDRVNNGTQNSSSSANENMLFWYELYSLINLEIANCPEINPANWDGNNSMSVLSGTGCNMAQAEIGDNENIAIMPLAYTNENYVAYNAIDRSNSDGNAFYLIDCSAQTNHNFSCRGAVSAEIAGSYDVKIDDAKANSGSIRGGIRNGNSTFISNLQATFYEDYDMGSDNLYIIIHKFPDGL